MKRILSALCFLAACFALTSGASADNYYFTGASGGNWNDGNNWIYYPGNDANLASQHGIPVNGTTTSGVAYVNLGTTVNVDSNISSYVFDWFDVGINNTFIPRDANGKLLSQPGSTLNIKTGANITETKFSGTSSNLIGGAFDGVVDMTGGTLAITSADTYGFWVGGTNYIDPNGGGIFNGRGTLKMEGGIITGVRYLDIARGDPCGAPGGKVGVVEQTGGTISCSVLRMGYFAGNTGRYIMSGGSLNVDKTIQSGSGASEAVDEIIQSGGVITVNRQAFDGMYSDKFYYSLSGGTLQILTAYDSKIDGAIVQTGGLIDNGGTATDTKTFTIGIRNGTAGSAGYASKGSYTITGGTYLGRPIYIGASYGSDNYGGQGTFAVGGTAFVQTRGLRIGATGVFDQNNGYDSNYMAFGELDLSGGSIATSNLFYFGFDNARGTANITGGTLTVDANSDSPAIGRGNITTGLLNSYAGTGNGSITQTGGLVQLQGSTNMIIARGAVGTDIDGNALAAPAYGTYSISGGKLQIAQGVMIAETADSGSRGLFSLTGGSTTLGGALIVNGGSNNTATLKVGKGAYLGIGGSLDIRDANRLTNTYVEVSTGGNTKIYANNASSLGGTLNVYGGRLGKEGDKVSVIFVANPDGDSNYLTGSFKSVLSDLTQGTFAGVPAYAGAIDGNKYTLTFQGMTGGDASGDHRVNIVDLGVLSSKWNNVSGTMTWQNADFSGDGKVNIVDLGVLSSNWSWVKPGSAPAPGGGDIPEPATLALISLGALSIIRRKKS